VRLRHLQVVTLIRFCALTAAIAMTSVASTGSAKCAAASPHLSGPAGSLTRVSRFRQRELCLRLEIRWDQVPLVPAYRLANLLAAAPATAAGEADGRREGRSRCVAP
jgi:hypothetical protein